MVSLGPAAMLQMTKDGDPELFLEAFDCTASVVPSHLGTLARATVYGGSPEGLWEDTAD